MKIINKIKDLHYKYNTTCPFKLCDHLDIPIEIENLGNIKGLATKSFDSYVITLNENMDFPSVQFTVAHELGHIALEHDLNTLFLSNYTYFVTEKFEREANLFATYLIIYDLRNEIDFIDSLTTEQLAKISGIPVDLIIENYIKIKSYIKSL